MKINNCIKNLLRLICVLQDNSTNMSYFDVGCTKPFLGPSISCDCYNTRVVTLYNKDGGLFSTSFIDGNDIGESSTFRIQSVNGDCCCLLILDEVDGTFISTKQYITLNISCICAVKCIQDVVVSNL